MEWFEKGLPGQLLFYSCVCLTAEFSCFINIHGTAESAFSCSPDLRLRELEATRGTLECIWSRNLLSLHLLQLQVIDLCDTYISKVIFYNSYHSLPVAVHIGTITITVCYRLSAIWNTKWEVSKVMFQSFKSN